MSEWIKCSDKPIPDRLVLAYFSGDYEFAIAIGGCPHVCLGGEWVKVHRKITHWMPLPPAPEDL
jgi:hypothetical protein